MIDKMTKEEAILISRWTYEGIYSLYSFIQDEETIQELMNGDYYSCRNENSSLLGYFCFQSSARIPTLEEDAYALEALDMGLGMQPSECDQGKGRDFMMRGLKFAGILFGARRFRLTVACFNERAIHLYKQLGFKIQKEVTHAKSQQKFYIMLKNEEELSSII